MYSNLTTFVGQIRDLVGPTFPIFTGGYVTYSSIGWTQPLPFYDLVKQSLTIYQPWLGSVDIKVLDSTTQRPVINAVVTVLYNGTTH
eukprot:gene56920-biopygen61103